jgi:hypothetical protein
MTQPAVTTAATPAFQQALDLLLHQIGRARTQAAFVQSEYSGIPRATDDSLSLLVTNLQSDHAKLETIIGGLTK